MHTGFTILRTKRSRNTFTNLVSHTKRMGTVGGDQKKGENDKRIFSLELIRREKT